ncbi:MAG: hypothetical protein N3E37_02700 [Candidatus Micrarchaeota archaeon]|nr:hypothetical protein [Candidatus Micrarchaeota archaeon]
MVIKKLKLQLSFEFVLTLGLIMIAVLPLIYIGYTKTNEALEDLKIIKLRYLVSTLKDKYTEVFLTKGEVKAKVLIPTSSRFSIDNSGSLTVLNASMKIDNQNSNFVATLPSNVKPFFYDNPSSRVDDEIIIRIFYNTTDKNIYTEIFS